MRAHDLFVFILKEGGGGIVFLAAAGTQPKIVSTGTNLLLIAGMAIMTTPLLLVINNEVLRGGILTNNHNTKQTQNICIANICIAQFYNAGPTSSPFFQHHTNVVQMFCVCWVTYIGKAHHFKNHVTPEVFSFVVTYIFV